MRRHYVYIMTNHSNTLYVGMTNDILRRVWEHRQKTGSRFTARYRIHRLIYCEECTDVHSAIAREKEIKGLRREKKVRLIENNNPGWKDLIEDWFD
jgi:putative endonuclease